MAKTKRVGLLFSYDEAWVAGAYYIMNLVQALKTLPIAEQPKLVFYIKNENDHTIVKQLNYNNYSVVVLNSPLQPWQRVINIIFRKLFKENRFLNFPNKFDLDIVFPYKYDAAVHTEKYWIGRLFWIPDFQEVYFPQFFSSAEISFRKAMQTYIVNHNYPVVLSSNNALDHLHELYGKHKRNEFVLNFAVTHPSIAHLEKNSILKKFGINQPFFFAPNQFWVHKNHKIILEALVELKVHHPNILVVFSGKESDYRNPNYFSSIKQFVAENNLESHVLFLGFIDREEQLLLIKESMSIIQPSLFEGWSTVVEDAKAFNKFIIASNLEVHKEQLNQNYLLFDPHKKEDLIHQILNFLEHKPAIIAFDYSQNVKKFGQDFMKIVQEITKH